MEFEYPSIVFLNILVSVAVVSSAKTTKSILQSILHHVYYISLLYVHFLKIIALESI